jgi:hypothetical protein
MKRTTVEGPRMLKGLKGLKGKQMLDHPVVAR